MTEKACDIVGCPRPVAAEVPLEGVVAIRPRRSTGDPVPLCAEHAQSVLDEIRRAVDTALERADPNRNRSNLAMASEDLGDAEE